MKIIGLTGPSGAGKGACGKIFSDHGIAVIDTDAVYHALLVPPSACHEELIKTFGNEILTESGKIDRPKLAHIVFSDKSGRKHTELNRITHAHVLNQTRDLIEEYRKQGLVATVIDAPLLFESGFDGYCDFSIAILADRLLRFNRILTRDDISEARAMERLNVQPDDDFYIDRADHVILNNTTLSHLKDSLIQILKDESIPINE